MMRTRIVALFGLALSMFAAMAAEQAPEDFVGPPAVTANGCPANEVLTLAVASRAMGIPEEHLDGAMKMRYLTVTDLCTMPKRLRDRAISRGVKPKPDMPDKWVEQRRRERADEDGVVKADGLLVALAHRNAMASPRGPKDAVESIAGIRSTDWVALGPGNIGGRIRAISPNPSNANEILLGSVSGGIWRTTNAGASWSVDSGNDFLANVAVATIARAPSNSSIVYAGTGEGFFNGDAIQGYGIFKSIDGGLTWSHLTFTQPPSVPNTSEKSDFYYVNRIAVHPTNANIVVAATRGYFSNWGGLWRSTDGGANWTKVYNRSLGDVRFDPDPATPNRVLVGERSHARKVGASYVNDGGGVATVADITTAVQNLLDSQSDGSFTRTKLSGGANGRVEVSYAPATAGLAVAVLDSGNGQLYVSTDHGVTWALNSTPAHLGGQGWYGNTVWVDPTNSTRLIVGGINLVKGTGVAGWWSTNTAVSWSNISDWQHGGQYGNSAHADHHTTVPTAGYDGSTNPYILFGTDGGLYRGNITTINADAVGTGWTSLNNNLAITQFFSVAGKNYGGSTTIVGGTQDNGSLKAPASGTNWGVFFGGDGGWSAVDPTDSNIYYGEYVFASVHRALSGGVSTIICNGTAPNVNNIKDGASGASYCGTTATNEANFISPFVLDPNSSGNTMLVGAKSLWRSTDVKSATNPTWSAIKAASGVSQNYISAVVVAPGNSNIVWVGHNNGDVYCTVNGSAASPTWTQVSGTPARQVMRIMIDPTNNNRIFVSSGGYSTPNLHETTGGCVASPTWTSRHNNLPAAPVRSIVRHQTNSNWLYVGTEVGVFASTDGGVTWSALNDGPGSVSVDELTWIDSTTLVAATHGRGMFKATVSPGTLQFTASTANAPEAGGPITVSVTRTGGSGGSVGVTYGTANSTGVAGVNYTAASGVLSWSDVDTATKTFNVPILNDQMASGNKTFTATLSSPSGGATLGSPSTITVTITDAGAVGGAPQVTNVYSRKTHGTAGTFDITLDRTLALTGAVTVDPRAQSTHKIVFQFGSAISAAGTAAVTPAGSANAVMNGSTVEVTLSSVPDNTRVTVALVNVNGVGANAAASVGFLVGDYDGTRTTDATDLASVKGKAGETTDGTNFRADVDLSGAITSTDILRTKGRLLFTIP
jgi:hypothetical protein